MLLIINSKCPCCGAYPTTESYTFEGITLHLLACDNKCIVPDELKRSHKEAREEWERLVEYENVEAREEKKQQENLKNPCSVESAHEICSKVGIPTRQWPTINDYACEWHNEGVNKQQTEELLKELYAESDFYETQEDFESDIEELIQKLKIDPKHTDLIEEFAKRCYESGKNKP